MRYTPICWEGNSTMDSMDELFRIIDGVKPGETVLIEYYPSYIPEFVTLSLVMYGRERGLPVIIDDNFDALHVIHKHLKLWGIEEDFRDVFVIKSDGSVDIGNVIAKIRFSAEPVVYVRRYEEAGKNVLPQLGESINIVLGLEKIFAFVSSVREFYLIITHIQRFLGGPRKAFYLVNKETARSMEFNPLPEMERIASTVVEIIPTPLSGRIVFKKTPIVSLTGTELEIPTEVMGSAARHKGNRV
ncbi:DUF257 family protein [Thermococcus sp.]